MSDGFYSTQEAVSDGTLTQLMVTIDFVSRDDVHVFFDGVEYPDRWEWASPSVDTIVFHSPVPEGQTILVRRLTQMDDVPHIFGEGSGAVGNSRFDYETVDENFDFFKRATQDSMDSFRLTGASAEQAEFWARRAEAAESAAEGHKNSAAASSASASVHAINAGNSASEAAGYETGAASYAADALASKQAAESLEGDYLQYRDDAQTAATNASDSATAASGSASAAAASASSASGSASAASGSASSAATSATNAQGSAAAASTSASQAAGSASTAGTHATNAGNSASDANTSRQQAEQARDKARDWAESPEDVEVEPGQFSALHWAEKAREFMDPETYLQVANNLSDLLDQKQSQLNLGVIGSLLGEVFNTDNCEAIQNSNGIAFRFPNGAQISFAIRTSLLSTPNATATTGIFTSAGGVSMVHPAPFSDIPIMIPSSSSRPWGSVSGSAESGNCWANLYGAEPNGAHVLLYSRASSGGGYVGVFAVGMWD